MRVRFTHVSVRRAISRPPPPSPSHTVVNSWLWSKRLLLCTCTCCRIVCREHVRRWRIQCVIVWAKFAAGGEAIWAAARRGVKIANPGQRERERPCPIMYVRLSVCAWAAVNLTDSMWQFQRILCCECRHSKLSLLDFKFMYVLYIEHSTKIQYRCL